MGKGLYIGIGVAVVLVIVLIFAFSSGGDSTTSDLGSSSSGENVAGQGNEGSETGEVKEFEMIARQFEFEPSTIEVNEGDTVIINVVSEDVAHGIAIPQFGVSEKFGAGEEVTVEFVADKDGTYTFFCNVFCGSGHGSMDGTLIVN